MKLSTKRGFIFLFVIFVFFGSAVGGLLIYTNSYDGRVFPGLEVEGIPVGGMTRAEVQNYFEILSKKISHELIRLSVVIGTETKEVQIDPKQNEYFVVHLDSEKIADYLVNIGKSGNIFLDAWVLMNSKIRMGLPTDFVVVYEEELLGKIQKTLLPFETKANNATLTITSMNPYTFSVGQSVVGLEFDYEKIAKDVKQGWYSFHAPSLTVTPSVTQPNISEEEASLAAETGKQILSSAISFHYYDEYSKRDLNWKAAPSDIAKWLVPQVTAEDLVVLGATKEAVEQYLNTVIAPSIRREPRNAEFVMQDGKITKFIGSQTGVTVKFDEVYQAINMQLNTRALGNIVTTSLALATILVEPDITTGEVNDLGIEDVLGVGYSSYKGSPANRIKNIRFAVTKKLNGILVKPGETFSLLNVLQPFTEEAGYLPELVIKGDRIKPEVGGGLCQVGSTMFRAAMNSGLDIVERRNHSLVVSYYNDHRNKMPGADATIYDPAPDFKFKNDTAGNILIMTDMNEKTQELFFTLWGKSDGRKGYYDPPILIKWIPTGPQQDIITGELPEGKKKCQEPHPGAVASLKYHREMPGGEKIIRVFDSHYRPLPRICLIGGIPVVTEPVAGQTGILVPSPAEAAIPIE